MKKEGRGGIQSLIIADRKEDDDIRSTSFSITYPLSIHAELFSHPIFEHRTFDPFDISNVEDIIHHTISNPAIPAFLWNDDQTINFDDIIAGEHFSLGTSVEFWLLNARQACISASLFNEKGFSAKQILPLLDNYRLLTLTLSFDNFEKIELLESNSIELNELIDCINKSFEESSPLTE